MADCNSTMSPPREITLTEENCLPIASAVRLQRVNRTIFQNPAYSLKVITQMCFLQNKEFYCNWAAQNPDFNPFSRISNPMKKEIIELYATMQRNEDTLFDNYDFQLQCRFLGLLLNREITSFHLPHEVMARRNEKATTVLCQQLVNLQPLNLHTLVSFSPHTRYFWDFGSLVSLMVDYFPRLEVLQMEGSVFGDDELIKVSKQLVKLRVLEVNLGLGHITARGISALSKLKLLQEFHFTKGMDMRSNELPRTLQMCFEHVPQLHIVGTKPEPRMQWCMTLGNACVNALCALGPEPRFLQLRRLVVSIRVYLPDNIYLPDLHFMSINWPSSGNVDVNLLRFHQLSELALNGVPQQEMLRILGQVGHQLDILYFEVHDIIRLDLLFTACPNLSEVRMHVFGIFSVSDLRPDTLRRLQKLTITFSEGDSDHQPGLLVILLRHALELTDVHFSVQTVYVEVLEDIFVLAQERTSMQKLENFKFAVDKRQCSRYQRALLAVVLLCCSHECEKLKHVEIDLDGIFDLGDSF